MRDNVLGNQRLLRIKSIFTGSQEEKDKSRMSSVSRCGTLPERQRVVTTTIIFSIKAATATGPSVIFQQSSNKLIHGYSVDSVEPLNTESHGNDDDVVGFTIFKYDTRYPVCVQMMMCHSRSC